MRAPLRLLTVITVFHILILMATPAAATRFIRMKDVVRNTFGVYLALSDDGLIWKTAIQGSAPGNPCDTWTMCGSPPTTDPIVDIGWIDNPFLVIALTRSGEVWKASFGNPGEPCFDWTLWCESNGADFVSLVIPPPVNGQEIYGLTGTGDVWTFGPYGGANCGSHNVRICGQIIGVVPAQPATWGRIKHEVGTQSQQGQIGR